MKRTLLGFFIVFPLLSADILDLAHEVPTESEDSFNRRFIPYVKLGPQFTEAKLMPELGFGFRSESVKSGVDASFSYSQSDRDGLTTYKITHPRVIYLNYLTPGTPTSLYYGFGSSWGTISKETPDQAKNPIFTGLLADLAFGCEFQRNSNIRQFIELDVSQPALPLYQRGIIITPSIELSYSLGF